MDQMIAGDKPLVIAGDLNAKHIQWNSKQTNQRGRRLQEYAENNEILGPNEDTHTHPAYDTSDVLDIAIIKNVNWTWQLSVHAELSSDHSQ